MEKTKLTKENAKKLFKLCDEWTRAEVMSRHGPDDHFAVVGDYFTICLEKGNEMRKLLYGTSDLVEIGLGLGILEEQDPQRHLKRKARRGKSQKNQEGVYKKKCRSQNGKGKKKGHKRTLL